MPYYDLSCKQCGTEFNQKATVKERDNKEIKCPQCGHAELEAVFKSVNFVIKSKCGDANVCPQAHRCGGGCSH